MKAIATPAIGVRRAASATTAAPDTPAIAPPKKPATSAHATATSSSAAAALERPTILLVGKNEPFQTALEDALDRHSISVESAEPDAVTEAVFAAAPDMVVLLGDAAAEQGQDALRRLASNAATAVVPVVILADDAALDQRLRAFRHGAVAVVQRTASVDEMARRIAELGYELPDRQGEIGGEIGEATVDELVALFSKELRSGILSISQPGEGDGDDVAARFVIRPGKRITAVVEDMVRRLKPMLRRAEPVHYEFHESPQGRLQLLDADSAGDTDETVFEGRRVLLVESNAARADALAQELRARGALVAVTDPDGVGLDRARSIGPEVVIVDTEGLESESFGVMRLLRRDVRLRWASMLVVRWNELWPAGATGPNAERLVATFTPLVQPDTDLVARARSETEFDTRLEIVGPARMLRALCASERTLHVVVRHPRVAIEFDVAEGIVVGATGDRLDTSDAHMEGLSAIAALLVLSSGRVHVEHRSAPSTANIMSPVDDTLIAATEEMSPIRPSLPPTSAPPTLSDARSVRPDRDSRTSHLEDLVSKLQVALPREVDPESSDVPSPIGGAALSGPPWQIHDAPTLPPGSPTPMPPAWPFDATLAGTPLGARIHLGRVAVPVWALASAGAAAAVLLLLVVLVAAIATGSDEPVAAVDSTDEPTRTTERADPATEPVAAPAPERAEAAPTPAEPEPEPAEPEPQPEPEPPEPEPAAEAEPDVEPEPEPTPEPEPAEGRDDVRRESSAVGEAIADREGNARERSWFYLNQGNYERNRGRHTQAIAAYQQAIQYNPTNSRAMVGIIRSLMARNRHRDAIRWANRLVRTRPRQASNHILLGDVLNAAGNRAGAMRSWRRALQLSPNHSGARSRLGV